MDREEQVRDGPSTQQPLRLAATAPAAYLLAGISSAVRDMAENLYNDSIIAEAKAKVGATRLDQPMASVERDNPLCGDRITLDLTLVDGHVTAIGHKTRGCMLTQAAASLIGRRAEGASPDELRRIHDEVAAMLKGEDVSPIWQELDMFRPVSAVKSRHECVMLPFDALTEALGEIEDKR